MANTFTSLIDLIYPKGSIYLQANTTTPATILGGTWGQIKNGLLACAGSSNVATVGNKSGSNTITVKQIPSHNHYISAFPNTGSDSSGKCMNVALQNTNYSGFIANSKCQVSTTESTGGGAAIRSCTLCSQCLATHFLISLGEVLLNG